MEHKVLIYTQDELYTHLVDYNAEEPTEAIEEIQTRIKYFHMDDVGYNEKNLFFVVKDSDKIIGVAKVRIDGPYSLSYSNFNKWISYISVDSDHHGRGIATVLVDSIMYYASIYKLELLCSGYSLRGWMYLRNTIHRLAKEHNVTIEDPAVKPEFYDSSGEGWEIEKYNHLWDSFRHNTLAI